MLLNTDGIDTTIDTRDLHWGKYNCSMAVYLENVLNESGEDESTSNEFSGEHVARIGRWIIETDSQGFVTAWKESTEADAIRVMDQARDELEPIEDEDEEGSE